MGVDEEQIDAEFQISNFKSYFGDPVSLNITKPITIIAGPNGEGKTNLLEAMFFGVAKFVNKSRNHKKNSLITKSIKISPESQINTTSLYDLIFTDLIKKGLAKRSSTFYQERLSPKNIVSHRRKKGTVLMRILKRSNRGEFKLAEMKSTAIASPPSFDDEDYLNKLDHLELLYLNSDTNDFFVKLVGQEFSDQLELILGTTRKAEYQKKILKILPDEDRLIRDIEKGTFEEKYLEGTNLFLTSNLATGAKKECILYILNILAEKHKEKKKWIVLFLIDELEEGLHVSRQKKLIDALIRAFQENEVLKKHVKIVMTTHSPIIYSELMKYPEYVDVHFALRNPKEPSKILQLDDTVDDESIAKKRILSELGLNLYEFPRKIVFVEGKTDKWFWNEILEDIKIFPLNGASIPNILIDLVSSFPLARSKEYFMVVDKSGLKKVMKDAEELNNVPDIKVNTDSISYNSLEELIFGVNIKSMKPSNVWNKIEKKVEEFNETLEIKGERIIEINVQKPREKLEKKGKEGLNDFFNVLKKKEEFYKLIGRNWSSLLEEKVKGEIKTLQKKIEK